MRNSPETPTDSNELRYDALPSVAAFHNSFARVRFLCGPVGSGKSSAAIMDFAFLCIEADRPMRGLVVRETKTQLKDSTKKTALEWLGHCAKYVDNTLHITLTGADGIERTHHLDFRSARRKQDAQSFQSTEYAWIWLEEVVPAFDMDTGVIGGGIPRGVFEVLVMRQRQKRAHRLDLVITFNPPNKFHWVYREVFRLTAAEREARDYALFRQPARENMGHLPPGYYAAIERILGPELAARFVDGQIVTIYPGRRVYPEFIENVHFVETLDPVKDIPVVTMHDFGRTPATLICQIFPSGLLHVLYEIYMTNAHAGRMAEQLKFQLNAMGLKWSRGWGDPSGADTRSETDDSTAFDVMTNAGFPIRAGAIRWTHRREVMKMRAQRSIDGRPAILVNRETCPVLAEGLLGGYRYGEDAEGLPTDAPLKNQFSHSCNALEYGMTGEYGLLGDEMPELDRSNDLRRARQFDPLRIASRQSGDWMLR